MMRLVLEDYLYNQGAEIALALDNYRLDLTVEFGIYPRILPSLTVGEIGDVLQFDEVMKSFGKAHPEHKPRDTNERKLARAVFDNFKYDIFRSQFPGDVESVVRDFANQTAAIDDKFSGKYEGVSRLRRSLKAADLFNDHKDALVRIRETAHLTALALHDDGHALECRALMQMASASIFIVEPEKCRPVIRVIANDNASQIQEIRPMR